MPPPPRHSWSRYLNPEPALLARHTTYRDIRWDPAGDRWDAVSMPLSRGLAALDRLHLTPHGGYPVLADYGLQTVYMLVPAGTGAACSAIPGVRIHSRGTHLLVPRTPGDPGTLRAHWLSPPACGQLIPTRLLISALLATTPWPPSGLPVRRRPRHGG